MSKAQKADENKQRQDKVFFRGGFWWIALGAVILVAVVIRYSRVFDTLSAQYTFIGQNVLNVLIAAAIVVQALIYRRQWDAMRGSLTVARDSAKTARDAFYVGEAPYFGIKGGGIHFTDLVVGRAPGIDASFMNGGKTPAWHFQPIGKLVIGDSPDGPDFLPLISRDAHAATFIPSGAMQGVRWRTEFIYTQEVFDIISSERAKFFAVVEVHYMDMRKVWRHRSFRFVWNHGTGTFSDCEVAGDKCHYCKRSHDPKEQHKK
jgi:hypothetical protein